MSVINNKNKRVVSIAGFLLCIFYVAFIAIVAVCNSSIDWQSYGYTDYYDNGPKSPDMWFVFKITGIAFLYVIPWMVYFLNRTKIAYRPCGVYAVFTILLVICYFITFFPPYEVIHTTGYGPSNEYFVHDNYSDSIRYSAFAFFLIGSLVYIPVSIRMLIKIKRDKDNITRAEKIEG